MGAVDNRNSYCKVTIDTMHEMIRDVGVTNHDTNNRAPVKKVICEVSYKGQKGKKYEVMTRGQTSQAVEGKTVRILALPEIVKLCKGLYDKKGVKEHWYSRNRQITGYFQELVWDKIKSYINADYSKLTEEKPIKAGEIADVKGSLTIIQKKIDSLKFIFEKIDLMTKHALARRDQDKSLWGRVKYFCYKIFRAYERFIDHCKSQMQENNLANKYAQRFLFKVAECSYTAEGTSEQASSKATEAFDFAREGENAEKGLKEPDNFKKIPMHRYYQLYKALV